MGGSVSPMGKGKGGGGAATQPAPAPAAVQQAQANPVSNATALTDSEADNLRKQEDSIYDANTTAAVKMYISNTDFDGNQHSMSQTMNYLLDNGVDFDTADRNAVNRKYGLHLSDNDWATMQYTNAVMDRAGHPLGKDTILQRGAHDDLLRNTFGISDYSRMSEGQLQKALVGQAFRNTSPMSTSYDVNKNPFLGASSGVSGGREVVFNIKAGKNTKVLFGAKKQSEVIVSKGTDWKITGVRYSGKIATPRGGSSKKQLVIDIETF